MSEREGERKERSKGKDVIDVALWGVWRLSGRIG